MAICARPARVWLPGVVSLLALLGSAPALGAEASTASAATGRPFVPAPGQSSALQGVACPSATSCWAVGNYTTAGGAHVNEVLHWNGRRWSRVPVPSPGGTTGGFSGLGRVTCVSPASCWAVGEFTKLHGPGLNQVLHWDGRRWSRVPAPDPGGTASGDFSALNAVSCPSTASCWAVGGYGRSGSSFTALNEVLHWNGRTWSLAASPDPDGTGPGAGNFLSDVVCTSTANCWAVGNYGSIRGSGVILNQALHWDGRTWSQAPTPNPAGTSSGALNFLRGVRCASPARCWAVGRDAPAGQSDRNQALRWNGTSWSVG